MATVTPDALARGPGRPAYGLFDHLDQLFIDGEWQASSSGQQIQIVSPSSEEPYVAVAEANQADLNRAVAAARYAFDRGPWPRLTAQERGAYIAAIADEIRRRAPELGHMWTSEVGAVQRLADGMPAMVARFFDSYALLADNFAFEERHPSPIVPTGLLVREPVGVVAAIIPWNAPLMTAAFKVAPALLAGCTIVLKCSPEAPTSGYALAEIAAAVGLPRGVLNVITAGRETSELLVKHPAVDKISFTGSSAAGKRIASLCGERMARATLELGGKSPALILDDYDLETAALSLAQSTRVMCGQVCASLTRVLIGRDRHDAFVEALGAAFGRIKIGDPFLPDTDMGPLATRHQRDRVMRYIALGEAEGAVLSFGGRVPKGVDRGFFIEPTIFAKVRNDMTIAREEIFGPVIAVIPTDDEQESILIANDSPFGLNASVFTNDVGRAYRVARSLRSGTVGHNAQRADFSIAFGGVKQSGIGREGGREGLLAYLESKTILLEADGG